MLPTAIHTLRLLREQQIDRDDCTTIVLNPLSARGLGHLSDRKLGKKLL